MFCLIRIGLWSPIMTGGPHKFSEYFTTGLIRYETQEEPSTKPALMTVPWVQANVDKDVRL